MTNPKLIATPFAENGDKNIIPESVGTEPQNATMQAGFPPITQQKISEGGIPPERNDFNGILNLYGQHIVHQNKGLSYEFDQSFAEKIGGYPIGAELVLSDGLTKVINTIPNNTNNPNTNSTGWSKVGNRNLTVDDFGAKGDGVTDDSEAFQAYIDSNATSNVVYLGQRMAKYCIKKEVDFKNKGLVGDWQGVQNANSYRNSIFVPDDFVGSTVFKNIQSNLRNLNVKQENANSSVNFAHVIPYQLMVSNLNIDGFGYQIYGTAETCVTYFSNILSINNKKSAIYFPDTGIDHTTTFLNNVHFQWGNYGFINEGNCYGFSFNNITVEQMLGGIKSKLFTSCTFDNFWCEGRQGLPGSIDVIEQITGQQLNDNYYGVFRYVGGWRSPQLEDKTKTATAGGVAHIGDELFCSDSTGGRTVFGRHGLRTSFSNWYAGTPANPRSLVITTQDQAAESGYQTPIEIRAPQNQFLLENLDPLDSTPFIVRRVVGKQNGGTYPHLAGEYLTTDECYSEMYNDSNGKTGKFSSMMYFTWDATIGSLTGGGWTLKKLSTGFYRLDRDSDNTKFIVNGHVQVSGVNSGSFMMHRITAVDSYAGSWANDRIASGWNILFANTTGSAVDPDRFTIGITLRP